MHARQQSTRICGHDLARMTAHPESESYSVSCGWWVCSLQRAPDLRARGPECMRASNLRAYARRDLARMTACPESARMSLRYFVLHSSQVTRHARAQVLIISY